MGNGNSAISPQLWPSQNASLEPERTLICKGSDLYGPSHLQSKDAVLSIAVYKL